MERRTINLRKKVRDLEHVTCMQMSKCRRICYVAGDLKHKHSMKSCPVLVVDVTKGAVMSNS